MSIHENWVHETARESAKKDAERIKKEGIVSPFVGNYLYQVKVGSSLHFTNSEERYKQLLKLSDEYKKMYRG